MTSPTPCPVQHSDPDWLAVNGGFARLALAGDNFLSHEATLLVMAAQAELYDFGRHEPHFALYSRYRVFALHDPVEALETFATYLDPLVDEQATAGDLAEALRYDRIRSMILTAAEHQRAATSGPGRGE